MYRKVVDQLTDLPTMPTIRIALNLYNTYSFLLLWFHRKMSLRKSQGYKVKRYMHAPSSFKNKDRLKMSLFSFLIRSINTMLVFVFYLLYVKYLYEYTWACRYQEGIYICIYVYHIYYLICVCVCVCVYC